MHGDLQWEYEAFGRVAHLYETRYRPLKKLALCGDRRLAATVFEGVAIVPDVLCEKCLREYRKRWGA
jgi:hypothetical protein